MSAITTTKRKYKVHVYQEVGLPVEVEADTQGEALRIVNEERLGEVFHGRLETLIAKVGGYVTEEVTGFLVDEVGDSDYLRSTYYTADAVPITRLNPHVCSLCGK
jgi:hypothetical protein